MKIGILDHKSSNICIPIGAINSIFEYLSKKSLEKVDIYLYSFELEENPTSKEEVNELSYWFEQFLESQRDFWFFKL